MTFGVKHGRLAWVVGLERLAGFADRGGEGPSDQGASRWRDPTTSGATRALVGEVGVWGWGWPGRGDDAPAWGQSPDACRMPCRADRGQRRVWAQPRGRVGGVRGWGEEMTRSWAVGRGARRLGSRRRSRGPRGRSRAPSRKGWRRAHRARQRGPAVRVAGRAGGGGGGLSRRGDDARRGDRAARPVRTSTSRPASSRSRRLAPTS